jgi:hypothetical protein
MTKPVRDYLEKQMENPWFAAEWARLLEEADPLEQLRRELAEAGETTSLPSERAEYNEDTVK